MTVRPLLRLAVPALLGIASATAGALETDQYWAWGLPLGDSTGAINAKLNLELERALASLPAQSPPAGCDEVAAVYRARMRFILMHDLQIWAWSSRLIDRAPDGDGEREVHRRSNLYSRHPLVDPGTWMPVTPTIEVAGVRFGTDKLAHFVSSGWILYRSYRKALTGGVGPEDAERAAVRRAILDERLILGGLTSGVQAIADLEAGAAGMRFYRDLCHGDMPVLVFDGERWGATRPVDLGDYVTPRWDESYQPSVFRPRRWRLVRPVLEGSCDRLGDPEVVARRRAYRQRDRTSPVAEVVAELVAAGALADPESFGIEAVCGVVDPSREATDEVPPKPGAADAAAPAIDLARAIADEEADRRRFALGLVGVHLTYPQVVSASVAVMATSQPRRWRCRTPCDFRGPFAGLEPGVGGVKVSVGWARVVGTTDASGRWLTAGYFGLAPKLTLLRTWGDDGWLPGNRTYAGVELGVPIAQANVGIGVLARVDGGDGRGWTITGSAGWGF